VTSTDVAVRNGHPAGQPPTALAIKPGQEMFDDKQRAALAALGIRNASNADLAVFMHYCQKTGLDPFSKQIYLLNRRENVGGQWVDKQTIQVGIEGFRVIRDRAARRDGVTVEYEDTVWYDADGNAYEIWLRSDAPAGCRMAVLKDGKRFPGVLTFAEYVQLKDGRPIGKWGNAPAHQIEKCAEAFALRRAFPHDLGGIYIPEETDDTLVSPADMPRPSRITAAEVVSRGEPAEGGAGEVNGASPPAAADDGAVTGQVVHQQPRARKRSQPAGENSGGQDTQPGEPALIVSSQIGVLNSHAKRLGFEEHEAEEFTNCIAILAGAPGLKAITDLTNAQAGQALQRLSKCPDRPTLVTWTTPEQPTLSGQE